MSANHVRAQRELHIAAPTGIVLRMFTPKGEELWIDAWRPRYVHPPDGNTVRGMVFVTGDDAEQTIWQLLEFDEIRLRAVYARTTPGLRIGTVTVEVEERPGDASRVRIRYDMTALVDEPVLEPYRSPGFNRMIEGWGAAINERLPMLVEALG